MFAGFAADAKAACDIRAGTQSALHGIADSHVFILNFFADRDAVAIMLRRGISCIREIVVEDDSALVDAHWKDEVGVHYARVGVDHEVRINPKVKGVTLASRANSGIGGGRGVQRAGLEARAFEIFDRVFGIFDDAA